MRMPGQAFPGTRPCPGRREVPAQASAPHRCVRSRGGVRKQERGRCCDGVSREDGAVAPRPSGRDGGGCAGSRDGDHDPAPGGRPFRPLPARRPSGGCVLCHCSRASSPYPDVCPCPMVGNRIGARQLAYAPGNPRSPHTRSHGGRCPGRRQAAAPSGAASQDGGAARAARPALAPVAPGCTARAPLGPRSGRFHRSGSGHRSSSGHRSGSGSFSQLTSSWENATGSSSWGKWPSPSNSLQR